jgi:hypothetical protein
MCACRAQRAIAAVRNSELSAQDADAHVALDLGAVTTACWVGSRGKTFATGHASGHVLLWSLPPEAERGNLRRSYIHLV